VDDLEAVQAKRQKTRFVVYLPADLEKDEVMAAFVKPIILEDVRAPGVVN
jgi:hypothetical protein